MMPHDPLTFACVAALLAITALSAVAVPAARATRVDPLVALRTEYGPNLLGPEPETA